MSISTIFIILLIHWIGDFVLQTDKQAKNKSVSWINLIDHTVVYTFMWVILIFPTAVMNDNMNLLWFIPITFICHTATDYYTSRVNRQLYEQNKIHAFFVSVGFDQMLHYLQLITTYYLLTR